MPPEKLPSTSDETS